MLNPQHQAQGGPTLRGELHPSIRRQLVRDTKSANPPSEESLCTVTRAGARDRHGLGPVCCPVHLSNQVGVAFTGDRKGTH
jgi:hypothetical protein